MKDGKIWQLLMDAIDKNRVIPIIGDEFFYTEVDGQKIPYIKFLLDELSKKYPAPYNNINTKGVIPLDFNMIADLIRVRNIMNPYGMVEESTNIYYEIDAIVKATPILCDEMLIEFLDKFHFPIILTTSFLPGIEDVLKRSRANLVVKSYDKSPRIDIMQSDNDILYYLFGKSNGLNKGYMVTEDDLLDYMHCWHNVDSRPKELCKLLSSKFLLVLGCDYPNWLFRFFWHSVKNFNLSSDNEGIKGVVAGNNIETDTELSRFLSRIQTHAFGSCNKVLEKMLSISPKKQEPPVLKKEEIDNAEIPDIFISYSHEDSEIAKQIARTFEEFGAKVWFDSTYLVGSDLYDMIIRRKIEECKRFVPLLSTYTENAARGYFRKEWALSLEENKFRLGSPYISPIIIDDADINSPRIPREFKDAHTIKYKDGDFESEVKKLIRSFR